MTVPDKPRMPRIVAAIVRLQTGQLMLGRQVLNRARSAGDRSQFENTWRVGDPLAPRSLPGR
jgi:hypothetical protein